MKLILEGVCVMRGVKPDNLYVFPPVPTRVAKSITHVSYIFATVLFMQTRARGFLARIKCKGQGAGVLEH